MEPGILLRDDTADTAMARSEDWFEPDMAEVRFAGLLVCDNPDCRDPVAVAGILKVDYVQVGPADYEEDESYRVEAVTPPPTPFFLSPKIPEKVKLKVLTAARLFWSDLDASANMIRQAVEALFDEERVKKYPRQGSRLGIALHHRIVDFQTRYPEAGECLLAIKWIGNAGSHKGGLVRDAVLDGFELLEHALEAVYVGSRRAALAKAKKINSRKRPLAPASGRARRPAPAK